MTRIAIIGGGISGLTAAYELELARKRGTPIDWHLYEAIDCLGGIIETTRIPTPEGEFILEGGPDAWVSEKPWARDLAMELGLEADLIFSNDATRKTYILRDGQLLPIPDHMRLMVPEDLTALDDSPLFSPTAKAAYAAEPTRAAELKVTALDRPGNQHADESVASFVRRHFGDEVLSSLAAPLLSGVFGGDVHKLSVRAVMPQFVGMEREHGSLIVALQSKSKAQGGPLIAQPHRAISGAAPIFTSLRRGMASLVEALVDQLPAERLHLDCPVTQIMPTPSDYEVSFGKRHLGGTKCIFAEQVVIATSSDTTRRFLGEHIGRNDLQDQLPIDASSAILVALAWPASLASTFTIPPGFGFLVPSAPDPCSPIPDPCLLATTFVDQKFPHRAPAGSRILRAFFGGPSADALANATDDQIAQAALTQLRAILGPIPDPIHTHIRRLPRGLPQYEVGHLDRIAELERLVANIPGLHLLGNSYHGVGIPDLIRDARTLARRIVDTHTP